MLLFVQKSGILTVQRESSDNHIEEASLLIRSGQITDAVVGNARGADALKKINSWTKCYFVFQAQEPATHPSSPTPFAPISANQRPERQSQPLQNSAFSVIPCRTPQFQRSMPDFEQIGLSRAHRQLFLLADGQRPVDVLAKLLGRHPQEVLLMLNDLENLHLLSHV